MEFRLQAESLSFATFRLKAELHASLLIDRLPKLFLLALPEAFLKAGQLLAALRAFDHDDIFVAQFETHQPLAGFIDAARQLVVGVVFELVTLLAALRVSGKEFSGVSRRVPGRVLHE